MSGPSSPTATVQAQQLEQLIRSHTALQDTVQQLQIQVQRHNQDIVALAAEAEAAHEELDALRQRISAVTRACSAAKRALQYVWRFMQPF